MRAGHAVPCRWPDPGEDRLEPGSCGLVADGQLLLKVASRDGAALLEAVSDLATPICEVVYRDHESGEIRSYGYLFS